MRFAGQLLARLQFDDADAQRRANNCWQACSVRIQNTAILTGKGLIVFRHPLLAHLDCFLGGLAELHVCLGLKPEAAIRRVWKTSGCWAYR